MKTKGSKKSEPAAKNVKRTDDPVKSTDRTKPEEEVCALTEEVVREELCCCETAGPSHIRCFELDLEEKSLTKLFCMACQSAL